MTNNRRIWEAWRRQVWEGYKSCLKRKWLPQYIRNLSSDSEEKAEERILSYTKGAYHLVKMGDLYNNRYSAICRLGCGMDSTVWLCWDLVSERFVALKVFRSECFCFYNARIEIERLNRVQENYLGDPARNKFIQLLDHFNIPGVNGEHTCIVYETLGPDLVKLMRRSNNLKLPIANVKDILRQVLQGLDYLHNKCQIIHADIKPDSILTVVDENYVRKLAYEAVLCEKIAINLHSSLVNNASLPSHLVRKAKKPKGIQTDVSLKEIFRGNVGSTNGDFSSNESHSWSNSSLRSSHQQKSNIYEVKKVTSFPMQIKEKEEMSSDFIPEISKISIKIADLGGSCLFHERCIASSQTSPAYRSLEMQLGGPFGPSTDIWSVACLAFELATGDMLFCSNVDESSEDDISYVHLMQIIKLLGKIPKDLLFRGLFGQFIFTQRGTPKHFKNPEPWSLYDVLIEKYIWKPAEAQAFCEFIIPMLAYDPKQRPTISDCLKHPWLLHNSLT